MLCAVTATAAKTSLTVYGRVEARTVRNISATTKDDLASHEHPFCRFEPAIAAFDEIAANIGSDSAPDAHSITLPRVRNRAKQTQREQRKMYRSCRQHHHSMRQPIHKFKCSLCSRKSLLMRCLCLGNYHILQPGLCLLIDYNHLLHTPRRGGFALFPADSRIREFGQGKASPSRYTN